MDGEHIVESGYDRMAEHYLGAKDADDPLTLARAFPNFFMMQ
jgi:hypothetical protein